jgi:hypothetical protein
MAKRPPITSIAETVKVMAAAQKDLLPPVHVPLTEDDMPFWGNVIAEKPKLDWTAHELELAALLAQSMRQLVQQNKLLEDEGPVIYTVRGDAAQNPRLALIRDAHARLMKYRVSLGITVAAKGGNPKEREKRKELGKQIEAQAAGPDPRFARPTFQ